MSDTPSVKVGDRLAFRVGWSRNRYEIHVVGKITPKGWIKVGHWTLNPDLTVRGRSRETPYKAEHVTPEIARQYRHEKDVDLIRATDWRAADAKLVAEVAKLIRAEAQESEV